MTRLGDRLGALPATPFTWGLAFVFAVWILLDVFVLGVSSGLARPTYDAMVRARLWAAAPDPRIVIVDIDEASLARMSGEFGRWPWPRDTLATVLDQAERAAPAAVVWDIVFSDADATSPGGDAAFDAAARRSTRSHFAVVRLPPAADITSQVRQPQLPRLWLEPGSRSQAVAVVPPVLAGVAQAPLGFNNGYPDADGVLRRYRYAERLSDGGVLRSLAASAAGGASEGAERDAIGSFDGAGTLIAWRSHAMAYPRIPFWQLFAQAESGKPLSALRDKVVVIGSTAASLHDVHPTPLSPLAPGVDTLATAIDNAMNRRQVREIPVPIQAILAIGLCFGLALVAQKRSLSALDPLLWFLPLSLLAVSFASLHGLPVFIDLHLPAGFAVLFLAVLRMWKRLRRRHWCSLPAQAADEAVACWPLLAKDAWNDALLERLLRTMERHAPSCRVIVADTGAPWPASLCWPELARQAAVVGPAAVLREALPALHGALQESIAATGRVVVRTAPVSRQEWVALCLAEWTGLSSTLEKNTEEQDGKESLALRAASGLDRVQCPGGSAGASGDAAASIGAARR